MSQALYRKYRSRNLDEVLGQDHITSLLKRALKSGKTTHAYLLTGPRGTGKTSVARILAHEITKLPYTDSSESLDIIEIDAASNNGVDDVRDLRDKALVAPVGAPKKIYIIDEVHMLSKAAFNALLKLMEEPPAHIVFILATTDFDKVPDTIVSRTQRYHFRLVDTQTIARHLEFIAEQEAIAIDGDALELIAERGGGSFRDSISLLDQIQHSAVAGKTIKRADIENTLGLATTDEVTALGQAILLNDSKTIIDIISKANERGVSSIAIASQLHRWAQNNLQSNPQLVHYLEGLVQIPKSHHPDISLLVTSLQFIDTPKPTSKTIAAAVSSQASVESPRLAQSNSSSSQERDANAKSTQHTSTKSISVKPTLTPKPTKTQTDTNSLKPPVTSQSTPPDLTDQNTDQSEQTTSQSTTINFDWQSVKDYSAEHKTEFIGVHSLLAKCSPSLNENTLTLYTGNKFNKDRLDSPKNRAILGKILEKTGASNLEIETIASPPPPKDEQVAKIAALMGGGEEINV